MFAAVLAYCMEYGATYATNWSMFENGGSRKGTDFSMFDGKNLTPRSSARHQELIAKYFTGEFIKCNSLDSNLMVFGAKNKSQLSVMIMNTGFKTTQEYTLSAKKKVDLLTGLSLTVNSKLKKAYKDKIAPRTTQVLIFKGNKITKVTYTSNDFDQKRAPVLSQIK
jgi:hypothetical protein